MNEKGVEGRLRAAVADAIFDVYDNLGDGRPQAPGSRADLRAANAAIAVVLDQAAEQIKAQVFPEEDVSWWSERTARAVKADVLAVLAEMRGDDG